MGRRAATYKAARMIYGVELTESAEIDYQDAINWYARVSGLLASDFVFEVAEAVQRIRENPFVYAQARGGRRRAPIHRFPYGIVYEIIGTTVVVMAVFHTSRDPSLLSKRA